MASHTKQKNLDLSLYLVTDSTPAILGDKDLIEVVEDALRGGVTIVQYRDKHADTGRMVAVATKIRVVTQKYKVPLLINDRVDVCLAMGADGVHLGQDDMEASLARSLLGPDAIIGVTAASIDEAQAAIAADADYLGIGTMFATPTKTDTKSIIGTQGTRAILDACEIGTARATPCVAIGSINASNVQRVLHQSAVNENRLNGVAVVSAIMASTNPEAAARDLRSLVDTFSKAYYVAEAPGSQRSTDTASLVSQIPSIMKTHVESSVLCHNMTNTVVQNFAANVCLATGSSPIMSLNGPEATDLANLGGGLVINMGTVTPEILEVYLAGMRAYNAAGHPILFDPVGGGATSVRRAAIKRLLAGGYFSVIKGNEGEIGAVAGTSQAQQRGVDSGPSTSSAGDKASLVKMLAKRERCIVLMTGVTDYLSDGDRTVAIGNGSHWLGKITGSGCALGSVIAGYVAVHRKDKLLAALAGILHYEIAAERAQQYCRGPGSFIPAFLDELYIMGEQVKRGEKVVQQEHVKLEWLE